MTDQKYSRSFVFLLYCIGFFLLFGVTDGLIRTILNPNESHAQFIQTWDVAGIIFVSFILLLIFRQVCNSGHENETPVDNRAIP